MKNLAVFSAVLFTSLVSHASCPGNTEITQEFLNSHTLTVTFADGLGLRAGHQTTTFDHINGWRKYWGTARAVTIHHTPGTRMIPPGTALTVAKRSTSSPGSADEFLSSSLAYLNFENNPQQIEAIKVLYQPYSSLRIRHLEKILGAEIDCE